MKYWPGESRRNVASLATIFGKRVHLSYPQRTAVDTKMSKPSFISLMTRKCRRHFFVSNPAKRGDTNEPDQLPGEG
jgi:hypothetical protein